MFDYNHNYIFNIPLQSFFLNLTFLFDYNDNHLLIKFYVIKYINLILIIYTQLYGWK